MTLILSQVTIMSETEEINSGMLKAQDLSYHSSIHSSETVVSKQATWLYVAGSSRPLFLQGGLEALQ